MDYTNRQIGSFRAKAPIAQGGFSVIWKGEHVREKGKAAAIKIMTPNALADRTMRKTFAREWRIGKRLEHCSVLKYYESGAIDGFPFLIMEYFTGSTLRELLTQAQEKVRENFGKLFGKMAEGLAYLHAQGVVHRDIKPENIMVSSNLETRLIDFSIAQTRWQRLLGFSKRKAEGSPTYIAPEVLRGFAAKPESDIYSLGAVAYEMLTGRPPFTGTSVHEVMHQHITAPPPPLGKVAKGLDPALDKLIQNMLAKNPADRPAGGEGLIKCMRSGRLLV